MRAAGMAMQQTIRALLKEGCPSIQYRVRTELLGESPGDEFASRLQDMILQDEKVREAVSWQGQDGWRSSTFHGRNGIEAGIRLLCEKGVSPRHPAVRRALEALRHEPEIIYRGVGKPGRVLDELGFGGSQMIRAVVFAYAGVEDEPGTADQIALALRGLDFAASVDAIEEIATPHRDRLVFKPDVLWPSIYHLRLLAYTKRWRTPHNYARAVAGIKKLVELSPLPHILVWEKSQFISPASFAMDDFKPDMEGMSSARWMQWFHRMELLARTGVIGAAVELRSQLERLDGLLAEGDGRFARPVSHRYFHDWGAYAGLSLEKDWRSPRRRESDLTFRSLLIRHEWQDGVDDAR